ncbi:MAG: DUF3298 domain-containing protein [Chloroflexota bacterium]
MKTLFLVCLCVLMSLPVLAQEDECLDLGGTFDTPTNVCSFANGLTIEIDIPVEFASYPASTMTVINQFLDEQRTQIFEAAAADPTPPGHYFLSIETDIFSFDSYVRSVLFTISAYTGGAHPNLYYTTYTFDRRDGHLIDLEHLLTGSNPLATISPIVQADLLAQMGADADATWITSGTGTTRSNYASFVLTDSALIFYFPPYQVAPYVAGAFTVEVPFASIRAVFRPPYLKG